MNNNYNVARIASTKLAALFVPNTRTSQDILLYVRYWKPRARARDPLVVNERRLAVGSLLSRGIRS